MPLSRSHADSLPPPPPSAVDRAGPANPSTAECPGGELRGSRSSGAPSPAQQMDRVRGRPPPPRRAASTSPPAPPRVPTGGRARRRPRSGRAGRAPGGTSGRSRPADSSAPFCSAAVSTADSDSPRAHRCIGQANPRSGSRVRSTRWRRSSASSVRPQPHRRGQRLRHAAPPAPAAPARASRRDSYTSADTTAASSAGSRPSHTPWRRHSAASRSDSPHSRASRSPVRGDVSPRPRRGSRARPAAARIRSNDRASECVVARTFCRSCSVSRSSRACRSAQRACASRSSQPWQGCARSARRSGGELRVVVRSALARRGRAAVRGRRDDAGVAQRRRQVAAHLPARGG